MAQATTPGPGKSRAALPVEVTTIDAGSLERLVERIAPLIAPEDHALIVKVVGTLLGLLRVIREQRTTLARLRRLLGMSGSEKTSAVLDRKPGEDVERPTTPDGGGFDPAGAGVAPGAGAAPGDPAPPPPRPSTTRKKPRKGHGRRGVADYPHACHTPVAHETLRPGDICPVCGRGRLMGLPPTHWLRIVGQPPLVAECSCLERLRCCLCGEVFTAKAPPEAQGVKMTPSAVAMIATLHHCGGMPFHRLEQIQENTQTPLPASNQSEAMAAGAQDIRPVHELLKAQAARGTTIYLDDTRELVLEFMGKRRAALLEAGKLPNPERHGLFTTGLVSRDAEHLVALFLSGRKYAGENLSQILDLRPAGLPAPILMSDALSWNAPIGHIVVEAHCIPHYPASRFMRRSSSPRAYS